MMNRQPATASTANLPDKPPRNADLQPADVAGDVVRHRCTTQRAELECRDAAVERRLAARIEAMPEATAELQQRIAEFRQRRAAGTCPGRCVVTGLPRSEL